MRFYVILSSLPLPDVVSTPIHRRDGEEEFVDRTSFLSDVDRKEGVTQGFLGDFVMI